MGIRDWFKKKEDAFKTKKIDGYWEVNQGDVSISVSNFTDTGITYYDLVDSVTPMKLYTFNMRRNNISTRGKAGVISGKQFETIAFEAPAEWDIESCIREGMLDSMLIQADVVNKSYNNGRQMDILGRFDLNKRFNESAPEMQNYIDNTYVPEINKQIVRQREIENKIKAKEENPGFLIDALGKMIDFFDGIKEKREARKQARLPAAQEEHAIPNENISPQKTREERGLSTYEIKQKYGKGQFRIGAKGTMLTDVSIIGTPQMLADGSYLYTVNRQSANSFDSETIFDGIANCQFSLPIPPEQLYNFLEGCEESGNPYAKSNADALMLLLTQKTLPGRGLYVGGLFFGQDSNLYYHDFQYLQDSIDFANGNTKANVNELSNQKENDREY